MHAAALAFHVLLTTVSATDVDITWQAMAKIRVYHGNRLSVGSGAVVGRHDGQIHVLTAAHVVRSAHQPTVEFWVQQGQQYQALIVAYNPDIDLALLAVQDTGFNVGVLPIAKSPPPVGAVVYTAGAPRGQWAGSNATVYDPNRGVNLILRETPTQGHSGGPTVYNGQLVGVMSGYYALTGRAIATGVPAISPFMQIACAQCFRNPMPYTRPPVSPQQRPQVPQTPTRPAVDPDVKKKLDSIDQKLSRLDKLAGEVESMAQAVRNFAANNKDAIDSVRNELPKVYQRVVDLHNYIDKNEQQLRFMLGEIPKAANLIQKVHDIVAQPWAKIILFFVGVNLVVNLALFFWGGVRKVKGAADYVVTNRPITTLAMAGLETADDLLDFIRRQADKRLKDVAKKAKLDPEDVEELKQAARLAQK